MQCQSLVAAVVQTFQCIDILVSCAGVLWSPSSLSDSKTDWDAVIAANLKGSFLCGASHRSAQLHATPLVPHWW